MNQPYFLGGGENTFSSPFAPPTYLVRMRVTKENGLVYETRASVRPENAVTYSAGNEGQKIVGICLKRLRSRVVPRNMSEEANMLIIPTYRCQLSPLDTQRRARGYPTIVNNIQPCPKQCPLVPPLTRVGARTNSTTRYSYNARRGQFPRTRIGIIRKTPTQDMQYAPRILHFSAFH